MSLSYTYQENSLKAVSHGNAFTVWGAIVKLQVFANS